MDRKTEPWDINTGHPRWLLFSTLLRIGQLFRPILPRVVKRKIPQRSAQGIWPSTSHSRTMLILEACAQPSATPNVNAATARVLDRLGIQLIVANKAGCCGAVAHHLSDHKRSLDAVKSNIDTWWPFVEQGVEAIVITASGCGVMVKEYAHLLAGDAVYAEKAARVSALAKDISEVLSTEDLRRLKFGRPNTWSSTPPCTLQHG